VSSRERDVEEGLVALRALAQRITAGAYITDMAFSKVFYLLRSKFIPISDSYVRLCLGVGETEPGVGAERGSFYAARLERVARALREFGRANAEPLERLILYANSLPPVVPHNGRFRGKQIPVQLTRVRVLDILLWSEVAVHGRRPHPVWLSAHREAFGEPATEPEAPARGNPRTALPAVADVDVFRDDDEGYLDWLRRHPDGLVLNCDRSPRSAYLVLHRATCRTIEGTPARGTAWTGPYIKACTVSGDALAEWAVQATGGALQPCKLCRP
jgi:hypothetical protein